jgi:hypothetical protein
VVAYKDLAARANYGAESLQVIEKILVVVFVIGHYVWLMGEGKGKESERRKG